MASLPFFRLSDLLLIITTLVLLHARSAFAKACFDVNGDQTNGLPCEPDSTEDGPCCSFGDICLSNGLCRPGPDIVNHGYVDTYRSDCTDQTWTTSNCFSGCNNFTGNGLQNCGGNEYCCYDLDGCDCSSTSLFDLGPATFVTTLPLTTVAPTSTPASTSASTTADAAQVTSQPPSSSSASPTPTQTASKSSSNEVAIGAGVGVGLGVPLLALAGFMAYYFLRRRKRSQPPPYTGTPFTGSQMKPAELHTQEPVHEVAGYPGAYQPVPHMSERYAHERPLQSPQEMDNTYAKPLHP